VILQANSGGVGRQSDQAVKKRASAKVPMILLCACALLLLCLCVCVCVLMSMCVHAGEAVPECSGVLCVLLCLCVCECVFLCARFLCVFL
jgi:hypothetical protein